jgi:uncharacterized Zn-binding protein involved in type VI secretion
MKRVIRLDDPTNHGGKVTSVGAHQTNMMGKPVARVGDLCSCPMHGVNPIVEGDSQWMIDGIPVALEGHKTACGATLISTLPTFSRGN